MFVLAIDTATPAVTAGVVELLASGCNELATRVTVDPRAHVERLMPSVLECLTECGLALSDVSAIACGVGPGPFTGLRAGIVTASSLGDALGVPVYPVCTLDAIAASIAELAPNVLVVSDARRKETYWARYREGVRTDGPHVSALANVPRDSESVVAGAAAIRDALGLPVVDVEYPTPGGIVSVASSEILNGSAPRPVVPLYLRRPDAAQQSKAKRLAQLGEVAVSPLTAAEVDDCARLEKMLFVGDSPWSANAFRGELAQRHTRYFAAHNQAGQLIGYAGVALLSAGPGAESEVHTIAVDPQWQGLGVGRALLGALISVIDEHGGPSFLEVRTDNEPAQALYRSAGFEIGGTRRNYYQPSGADAFTMNRSAR